MVGSGFDTIAKGGLICGPYRSGIAMVIIADHQQLALAPRSRSLLQVIQAAATLALRSWGSESRGSNSWSSMKATMGDLIDSEYRCAGRMGRSYSELQTVS